MYLIAVTLYLYEKHSMSRAGHFVVDRSVYGKFDTRASRYKSLEMEGQLEFTDDRWFGLIASKPKTKATLVLASGSLHGVFTFTYYGNQNGQRVMIRSVGPVVMLTFK